MKPEIDLSYAIRILTSHAFHVANNTGKELSREQILSIDLAIGLLQDQQTALENSQKKVSK
jgi:hypothetical protein